MTSIKPFSNKIKNRKEHFIFVFFTVFSFLATRFFVKTIQVFKEVLLLFSFLLSRLTQIFICQS